MERPTPVRDLDWSKDTARPFADRAVDLWMEFLERLPGLPVSRAWKGRDLRAELDLRVPDAPAPLESVDGFLKKLVFDTSMYPGHPRFMAYVSGAGTVPGVVGDLIAAAINQNAGGYRLGPAATEVEQFVTTWFARELFGLPETAGGILTSGGAMANFIALKAARDATMDYRVRTAGVAGAGRVAWYASAEVHAVVDRAADMLGLGSDVLRKIPVDAGMRMDLGALENAMAGDVAAGVRPAVVIASAGTVATGAIDPVARIADLCERQRAWLHVDGAYGALAMLAPGLRGAFAGMERAQSIAFDPHKWLYTPHSGGCVVVRDLQRLADSFAVHPTYVHEDKERTGNGIDQSMLGPQFSRGFSALKIYLSLLAHGREAYARRIGHDVALAHWLAHLVDKHPELERVGEVTLSICCFRYVPPGTEEMPDREAYLDMLNERLLPALQMGGKVFCSNAVLGGRFYQRACVVNFRTEAEDMEALVSEAVTAGRALHAELRGGGSEK